MSIKDVLVSYEGPSLLDEIIELATRIDLRIQNRRLEKHQGESLHSGPVHFRRKSDTLNPYSSTWQGEDPEPMQLGRTSLSSEEEEQKPASAFIVEEQDILFKGSSNSQGGRYW